MQLKKEAAMSRNLLIYASGWEESLGKAILKIRIEDEEDQKVLKKISHVIDAKDRMEAEYEAFIHSLFNAYILHAERVRFISTNKEFVDQLNKRVKGNGSLRPMKEQSKKLIKGFKEVRIEFLEPVKEMAMAS